MGSGTLKRPSDATEEKCVQAETDVTSTVITDIEVTVPPERGAVGNLAPQYSSLCGILAGFAFVGFTIYLAADPMPAGAANVTAALFAAFAALTLLAILYGLMAADSSPVRVAIGLYVNGLPFGLGSITLFYTLTLMAMERSQLHATATIGRVFVLLVGPALVLARMNGGAHLLTESGLKRRISRRTQNVLALVLALFGLVLLIRPGIVSGLHDDGVYPAYIVLASTVVAGLLSPVIAQRQSGAPRAHAWTDLYLIGSFLALAANTIFAAAAMH
jgi:hypothetical protein